jgi:alpha-N-acetylglucosamine transferase
MSIERHDRDDEIVMQLEDDIEVLELKTKTLHARLARASAKCIAASKAGSVRSKTAATYKKAVTKPDEAYVTLATNDQYATGALVLLHSLRKTNTDRQVVIMVTDGVSRDMRTQLRDAFDDVISVNAMISDNNEQRQLLCRPDLREAITKIKCWTLTQFKKCVFLDADTLALKNIDERHDNDAVDTQRTAPSGVELGDNTDMIPN